MTPSESLPEAKTRPNLSEAWPFYIVCDVSESMHGEKFSDSWGSSTSPWKMMNIELGGLIEALEEEPEASHVAYLGTVEFSADARSVLTLSAASANPKVGNLSKGSWTNYVAVWQYLASLIPPDMERLRNSGRVPSRPTIFFITDGNAGGKNEVQTTADWRVHLDTLVRRLGPDAPRVVAIGLGSVNRQTLLDLHSKDPHGAAVIATKSGHGSELIHPVVEQIQNSIRDSAISGRFSWKPPKGMLNLCDKAGH